MSVGQFWATKGAYIIMGTGMMGARHSPPTSKASPNPANSTVNKRQALGAAPELVSEAGGTILCTFWEPSSLTLEAAFQATFWKPGVVYCLLQGSRLASL